jgi:hypothetical protein
MAVAAAVVLREDITDLRQAINKTATARRWQNNNDAAPAATYRESFVLKMCVFHPAPETTTNINKQVKTT